MKNNKLVKIFVTTLKRDKSTYDLVPGAWLYNFVFYVTHLQTLYTDYIETLLRYEP